MMKEEELRNAMPVGKPIISSRLPKVFSAPHGSGKKASDSDPPTNEAKNPKPVSPESNELLKVMKKLKRLPIVNPSAKPVSPNFDLQIQDMITISILRSSYKSGIVRKFLHAPTLKLYAAKEVPVTSFKSREKLLESMKSWQAIQKTARYLVEVSAYFWNSPEGCVTVVMEYMACDSLARLCESIGAIPEKILCSISKRILSALVYFNRKVGVHGSVDLNHIMFTREGKTKLGLALGSKLKLKEENKMTPNLEDDVFDFGATILAASVGGLEWANEYSSLGGECCLFHTAAILSDLPYLERFSKQFSSFLCVATRYSRENRVKIAELLDHDWLKSEEFVGADINIQEMLGMSVSNASRENSGNVDRQIDIIIESLQVVLTEAHEVKGFSQECVKELAVDLGSSYEALQKRLAFVGHQFDENRENGR